MTETEPAHSSSAAEARQVALESLGRGLRQNIDLIGPASLPGYMFTVMAYLSHETSGTTSLGPVFPMIFIGLVGLLPSYWGLSNTWHEVNDSLKAHRRRAGGDQE